MDFAEVLKEMADDDRIAYVKEGQLKKLLTIMSEYERITDSLQKENERLSVCNKYLREENDTFKKAKFINLEV